MTQFSQPFYDEYNLNWAPSSPGALYEMIDGIVADDDTYISATVGTNLAEFIVRLSPVLPPADNVQSLQCRLKRDSGPEIPVSICLLEGSRIIAAINVRPGAGWNTWPLPLSIEEIGRITNYGNLSLCVMATSDETQCLDTSIIWPMVLAVDFECFGGVVPHGTIYVTALAPGGGAYEGTGNITIDGQDAEIKVNVDFTGYDASAGITFLSGPNCCTGSPAECRTFQGGIGNCDPFTAWTNVIFDSDCCESYPGCFCGLNITE